MNEILNLILVFFLYTYWLIVPIVFLGLMVFLWKKRKSKKGGWVIAAVSLIGVVLMAWYGFGRVAYYDWQVKKMCAKDGGVTVYETVELPAEMIDKWGRVLLYHQTQGENALGSRYLFVSKSSLIHNDNPKVWRAQYQIYRRLDGKLLGLAVSYWRQGGGLPGPWHPSSFGCPKGAGDASLVQKIFIIEKNGGK